MEYTVVTLFGAKEYLQSRFPVPVAGARGKSSLQKPSQSRGSPLGINARQLSQRESQGNWYTVGAGSPGPVAAGRIPHKTSSVALTAMPPLGGGCHLRRPDNTLSQRESQGCDQVGVGIAGPPRAVCGQRPLQRKIRAFFGGARSGRTRMYSSSTTTPQSRLRRASSPCTGEPKGGFHRGSLHRDGLGSFHANSVPHTVSQP